MLKLSASLLQQPIVSLRTGGRVATTTAILLNPNNLKIEGVFCVDQFSGKRLILLTQDIRDIVAQGFIVDDHDALTEPSELVRLESIIELQYELIGKPVHTEKKERVGKVHDFAYDDQSFIVQKLYVTQSLLKSFSSGQLSIDRTEIVELTNRRVIIKELLKPSRSGLPVGVPAS